MPSREVSIFWTKQAQNNRLVMAQKVDMGEDTQTDIAMCGCKEVAKFMCIINCYVLKYAYLFIYFYSLS